MLLDIKQLKKIRKQIGLTQNELAKEAGVSQSMIAKIESGKLDPTYSYVKKIESAIGSATSVHEKSAEDIMNKKIFSLEKHDSVVDAAKLLTENGISQAPVTDQNTVIGLITETTLLKIQGQIKKGMKVEEIMEETPPIISKATGLAAITHLLKFYKILIIKEKGKMLGVITRADMIAQIT